VVNCGPKLLNGIMRYLESEKDEFMKFYYSIMVIIVLFDY
jgi:hypothetical protein